jgi:ankyrin repeat protein
LATKDLGRVGLLLSLSLCGCGVEEGSPRATVRFTGAYTDGERFAEGKLTFTPGGSMFDRAVAGMRRGESRHAEIPVPDCPGSARFVEFGSPDETGEGVEEQFRYRRDRGPLAFDLELVELCVPTYWVFMQGTLFQGRFDRMCRRIDSVEPAPEQASSAPLPLPREGDLDHGLIEAAYGWGKDREMAAVEALLEAGADPNATDASGRSALALAAETGNRAIPRLLFLKGARLSGSKFGGPTGLHYAAADGQIEILRSLLADVDDVNAVDECGLTPLLWALRNEASPLYDCFPGFTPDYPGILVELLRKGANARVQQGRPSDSDHCVGIFLPTGATPLHYAAAACYEDAARSLLTHEAAPDAPDDIGDTPLMVAAHVGCPEVVALLLTTRRGSRRRTHTVGALPWSMPSHATLLCRTT